MFSGMERIRVLPPFPLKSVRLVGRCPHPGVDRFRFSKAAAKQQKRRFTEFDRRLAKPLMLLGSHPCVALSRIGVKATLWYPKISEVIPFTQLVRHSLQVKHKYPSLR
jgi:hypothetical protein